MARVKGIKNKTQIPARIGDYPDEGCELYPTCLGSDEYPQCPFAKCIEDIDGNEARVLRKWFLRRLGK